MTKLSRSQQRDLEIMHLEFLDSLTKGKVEDIQQIDNWLSVAKLWYMVAVMLGKHTKLLQEQVKLAERMCREAGNGEFRMSDEELDSVRRSVAAMAWLAARVSQKDASLAVELAEAQTNDFLKEIAYSDNRHD